MKVNLKQLQERKEKQYQEQIVFMAMLGTAQACRNNGISAERTSKILNEVTDRVNELSQYLTANTCIYNNGKQDFDYEYNLETLRRLAEDYHIKFDENIFAI